VNDLGSAFSTAFGLVATADPAVAQTRRAELAALLRANQRAIERLGAKRDGLIRNHQIIDGRVRDTVLYSILANEWEGVKRNLQMRLARG
jgi:hypothetical protein